METLDIILLGYGAVLAYLIWERSSFQKTLESHKDAINHMIEKHNSLTEEVANFADDIAHDLDNIEEKLK
jgi:hypothetical protein